MLSTATRRSRLLASASSISRCSRASAKNGASRVGGRAPRAVAGAAGVASGGRRHGRRRALVWRSSRQPARRRPGPDEPGAPHVRRRIICVGRRGLHRAAPAARGAHRAAGLRPLNSADDARRTRARRRSPARWRTIMPPITPVPMARWRPSRRRVASASGSTPRPKASEVIRMGRSAGAPRPSAASTSSMPCSCWSLANSTIRIAFLADRPIVVSRPTWK